MLIRNCVYCEAPNEDEDGRHPYFFWKGVLLENEPDENGKYCVKAISGNVDAKPFGNPPKVFCTLECLLKWIQAKRKQKDFEMPKVHPLN